MNSYNQQYPYGYPQYAAAPPQPQWQAPPRRQGWVDPRPEQAGHQSPASLYHQQQFAYHDPRPVPPPPPPAQSHRPPIPSYDTSTWGVKYNQGPPPQSEEYRPPLAPQSEEYRPPLPPRPSSSTSHHGPTPQSEMFTGGFATSSSSSIQASNPISGWQDSFGNQSQTTHHEIPPPPPPRPPQYQAQMQADFQANSIAHQHYSHHPPSHHYDPGQQTDASYAYTQDQSHEQQTQSLGPQTPVRANQQHSASIVSPEAHVNGPPSFPNPFPVSPIEPDIQRWSQQAHHPDPTSSNIASTQHQPQQQLYSSALGTGGPSDWEHFSNLQSVSPEASPPPPKPATLSQQGRSDSHLQASASPVHQPVPKRNEHIQHFEMQPSAPALVHRDSDTSSAPTMGINRTGTIDSVIQAWNTPLPVSHNPVNPTGRSQPSSMAEQVSSGHLTTREKIFEKIVDPYDDLEPDSRASLKRYAAMLRQETLAETDDAKFETFRAFVKKEFRLRSMLYGIELRKDDLQDESKSGPVMNSQAINTSTAGPESSNHIEMSRSDPLSVSPTVAPTIAPTVAPALANSKDTETKTLQAGNSLLLTSSSDEKTTEATKATNISSSAFEATNSAGEPSTISAQNKPDLLVATQNTVAAGDGEFSPGGRPIFKQQMQDPEFSPGGRPLLPRSIAKVSKSQSQDPPSQTSEARAPQQTSPSANAPMVLADYEMLHPQPTWSNALISAGPSSATDLPEVVTEGYGPAKKASPAKLDTNPAAEPQKSVPTLKFEPARPAYAPFKYNPPVQAPTQPADQSYSSLRRDGAESGRLLVHETPNMSDNRDESRTLSPQPPQPQDEAFIGLIRSHSKAVRPKKSSTSNLSPIPQLRPGTPGTALSSVAEVTTSNLVPLTTATEALKLILPKEVPSQYGLSQHAEASALKARIDTLSDNFSFIHQTVVDWDRANRVVRKKQDQERNARQADTEAHIDGLFNDNEIGYADIGALEAEFKLAEAERQYEEDQQELESFTHGVYEPITNRLQNELLGLNAQYAIAVDMLDLQSDAASQSLKLHTGKAEMGFTMTCVLALFNKLEIRHQKIAEASVERERRRKRLELTVLYTNGDTAGVKKLEQEFAVAEKMQVLHEARARDTRANKLMDTFDRATVRGLGDNQTYIDELLERIKQLQQLILKDPANIPDIVYEALGPRDALSLAQKTIDFVLADSQKLLTVSNVADKMLNEADYGVSVAEARVSNADQTTYEKLAQEKEKEDGKIVEDTNVRMSSISKAPEEAIGLIREVVDKVGDDAEHQDRIKRALEAAKQRSAVGGGDS